MRIKVRNQLWCEIVAALWKSSEEKKNQFSRLSKSALIGIAESKANVDWKKERF